MGDIFQPVNKIMPILVVNEILTAFDAANNNVVQGAGRVNTGLSGHDRKAINLILNSQVYMLRALSYLNPLPIFGSAIIIPLSSRYFR